MSRPAILFLGGNGHSPARLGRARALLEGSRAFDLHEAAYPRAGSWEALLADVARQAGEAGHQLVYATGVGALPSRCGHGDVCPVRSCCRAACCGASRRGCSRGS